MSSIFGGSSGGGNTNTVQSSEPWSGVKPYLAGEKDADGNYTTTGIYPAAQSLYNDTQWGAGQQLATAQQIDRVNNRQESYDPLHMGTQALASSLQSGAYDPNYQRVANVNAYGYNPSTVDPTTARTAQGSVDPANALQDLLSGQVDNPYLQQMQQGSINTAMRGYQDATDKMAEQYLPAVRSQAVAAGQYGGSRQGIAEGLVGKQMAQSARDLGIAGMDSGNQLLGSAYENAQQRKFSTADNLDSRAQQASQFNATSTNQANAFNQTGRMATEQFNANLGLQNNTQDAANQAAKLANQNNALGLLNADNTYRDTNYANQMALYDANNQYDWNNLKNYSSIVSPGAGAGTSTSTTAKMTTNPFASAIGGGVGGAIGGSAVAGMLPSAWGITSGMGGLLGGGLGAAAGLLSDRRFKTDIKAMGKLDNGLTVYRYRYKAGGPEMLGVMADEVKEVNPGAVQTVDGVDFVLYGRL